MIKHFEIIDEKHLLISLQDIEKTYSICLMV